jgi:hypothetical protein
MTEREVEWMTFKRNGSFEGEETIHTIRDGRRMNWRKKWRENSMCKAKKMAANFVLQK